MFFVEIPTDLRVFSLRLAWLLVNISVLRQRGDLQQLAFETFYYKIMEVLLLFVGFFTTMCMLPTHHLLP
jgi:hypothetical protein